MLSQFSNPAKAQRNALNYLGKDAKLAISTRKDKKYMIKTPDGKTVHFGGMGYKDFTKTGDEEKKKNYLQRARKIKGDWKPNPYSPNNLAINILWSGN